MTPESSHQVRRLIDNLPNFLLSLGDHLGNVEHGFLIGNSDPNANVEAIVEKPEGRDHLDAGEL